MNTPGGNACNCPPLPYGIARQGDWALGHRPGCPELAALRARKMSQHCAVTNQHATCPRETTLGTSPCECPCHRGGAR